MAVIISGQTTAGVFYGIQSLLSLLANSGTKKTIPNAKITDMPRFEYRGMMLDVARNFHSVEGVKKLMDVMAMYKLNKLHLHLTDDEGWRIEIPGLPELTEVSLHSCFDNMCETLK